MILAPTPTPQPQVAPTLGSPGFVGFLFTFLLAAALIALAWSLTRQLRKVDRNARLKAAAEEGAANKPEPDDSAAAVTAATPLLRTPISPSGRLATSTQLPLEKLSELLTQ